MSSYSLPSVTQSLFRDQPSRLFALLWKIPGPFLDENRWYVIKVDDVNNSDGKASLKRQKSPETTTDTQGMCKFY